MNNKILILILSTRNRDYDNFIKNCTSTWVHNAKKYGIRCIFYSGGSPIDKLENDNLELNCDDSLKGTAFKLFKALEFIENNNIEFTHIYRTNLSSYIFIDDFIKYSEAINSNFYGGIIGKFNKISFLNKFHWISLLSSKFLKFQTIEYASGSGFFISKNLIELILKNKTLNFKYIDDVMIGSALKGYKITLISRFDISDKIKNYSFQKNCYHVRLKSSNRIIDQQRLLLLSNYQCLSSFIESETTHEI